MPKGWAIPFIGLLLIAGCKENKQPTTDPDDAVKVVKSTTLRQIKQQHSKTYPAMVSANQKVQLAFQVAGQIIEFPVAKGQVVLKDQLLAQLDARDYQHDVDEKVAILQQTGADLERFEELLTTGSIARARVDKKRAEFAVAKAQSNTAKKALADTSLRAPFDGVVADKYLENFENVKVKQPVLSLQDISRIEFIIHMPESDVFAIDDVTQVQADQVGPKVGTITLESLPDKTFPVHLKEYVTEADPLTQTYEVTLSMSNPKHLTIFPGMTASFTPDEDAAAKNTYAIPSSAIFTDTDGKSYIWVIEGGKATKQSIIIQKIAGDAAVIQTSLNPDRSIVTKGVHYLREGMKVKSAEVNE